MRPHHLIVLLSLCALPSASATAQPLSDPTSVEFTVSTNHGDLVVRYDLQLFVAGSSNPTSVISLGKPSPDDEGRVRISLGSIFGTLPPAGPTYEVRIAAVGDGGSAVSEPSNPFLFELTSPPTLPTPPTPPEPPTQSTPCSYEVSPASQTVGGGGGSLSFSVAASSDCAWTSSTYAGWIEVLSGGTGIGNGTVTVAVSNNPSAGSRHASVAIAGQSASVNQSGGACSFEVSPTSRNIERNGGVASVSVEAPPGCGWSASAESSWISITDGASGSGNGTVTFAITANNSADARSTSVSVAGRSVVFAQPAGASPSAPKGMRIIGN